jgi:hypothetical protein
MPPDLRRHLRFQLREAGSPLDRNFSAMLEVVWRRNTLEEALEQVHANRAHVSRPGQKGKVRVGVLLFALVLGVAVYLGIQAVPAYVGRWYLKDSVRIVLRDLALAPEHVEQGKAKILARAREFDIPVSERDVILTVEVNRIYARVTWQWPIGVFGHTISLPLEIEESASLP